MSDDVIALKPREDGKLYAEDVTMAQYLAVLRKLKSPDKNVCPTCGNASWDVHRDRTRDELSKPVILASPSHRDETLMQLSFFTSCGKCGYMRHYRAERIALLASQLP